MHSNLKKPATELLRTLAIGQPLITDRPFQPVQRVASEYAARRHPAALHPDAPHALHALLVAVAGLDKKFTLI